MVKTIGIILVVLGILALVLPGIPFTQREKVLDLGPIQATADKEKRVWFPPVAGVALLVVGGGLLVVGATKKA
jgi:hypothetical protein